MSPNLISCLQKSTKSSDLSLPFWFRLMPVFSMFLDLYLSKRSKHNRDRKPTNQDFQRRRRNLKCKCLFYGELAYLDKHLTEMEAKRSITNVGHLMRLHQNVETVALIVLCSLVVGDAPLVIFSRRSRFKQLLANRKNDAPSRSRVVKNRWSSNCS